MWYNVVKKNLWKVSGILLMNNDFNNNEDYEYDPEALEKVRQAKLRREKADQLARDRMHAKVTLFAAAFIIVLIAFGVTAKLKNNSDNSDGYSDVSSGGEASSALDYQSDSQSESESDSVAESENESVSDDSGDYAGQAQGHTLETIDGITYVDGILIVNKTFTLPSDYDPGLDAETEAAFNEMAAAAWEDGITLWIASGYRSYERQEELFAGYASERGLEGADLVSARPGHSEHQSGLCVDVNDPSSNFNGTAEALWLDEHCAEYGFIIRFPEGKEDITGYKYEPWHIRYVGTQVAQEIMSAGICLEEYLGVTSDYADSPDNDKVFCLFKRW